jgi:hypothetical protein
MMRCKPKKTPDGKAARSTANGKMFALRVRRRKEGRISMDGKFEICAFSPEAIEEAIDGLDGLQSIIIPFLLDQNHEGLGESDAEECKKHLMMGKHALILMLEGMNIMAESGK